MDIVNENFDYWFNKIYLEAGHDKLKAVPDALLRKINQKKSDPSKSLKFYEKVYILTVCFKYRFFHVLCTEEGVDIKTFNMVAKGAKNAPILKVLDEEGVFVVGDAAIARSFSYAAHIQGTDIYNLIKDYKFTKNLSERKHVTQKKAISTLVDFISNYESKIRKILGRYDLIMVDFNTLSYHYNKERAAADFYHTAYQSYKPNSVHLRKSVYKMVQIGYLQRRGSPKFSKYSITAIGIDLIDKIFDELITTY